METRLVNPGRKAKGSSWELGSEEDYVNTHHCIAPPPPSYIPADHTWSGSDHRPLTTGGRLRLRDESQ